MTSKLCLVYMLYIVKNLQKSIIKRRYDVVWNIYSRECFVSNGNRDKDTYINAFLH